MPIVLKLCRSLPLPPPVAFNEAYGTMPGTDHEMSYNQAYSTAHEVSYNQAYNTTTSFMVQNKDALGPGHEYETMEGLKKMGPPPPYTQVVEGENQRSSGIYETIPVDNPLYDN